MMTEKSIRQRWKERTEPSSRPSSQSRSLSPQDAKTTTNKNVTVRYMVVWAARILLPIVYLLSTVKPVIIPSTTERMTIEETTAILVITHSRDVYLQRCLHSIVRHHPGGGESNFPIYVSRDEQDGYHESLDGVLKHMLKATAENHISLTQFHHNDTEYGAPELPSQHDANGNGIGFRFMNVEAYVRISRHYKWAINKVFSHAQYEQVIIIEDDMEIASDFYMYFKSTIPLLRTDDSLFAISAWNDNGIHSLSVNPSKLYRTDFFPGLGWVLAKDLWQRELEHEWPDIFWDDWIRHTNQSRGRQCIRPEQSRVRNFGRIGVSQSFQHDKHVAQVTLPTRHVPFDRLDLAYLRNETYFHDFFTNFSNATRLTFINYLTSAHVQGDVIVHYPKGRLNALSKRTGIMMDDRDGVARTSYHGVIPFAWDGHMAYAVEKGFTPPQGYTVGCRECC